MIEKFEILKMSNSVADIKILEQKFPPRKKSVTCQF